MSNFDPVPSTALHYRLDGELKTVILDRPAMMIGRSPDCDISLSSRMVSRQHARVSLEGGAWWIEDQKSSGGTYVNGQRIERQQLHDGDSIKVGDVELNFSMIESHPNSSPSASTSEPEPIGPLQKRLSEPPPSKIDSPGPRRLTPNVPSVRTAGDIAELKEAVHAKLMEEIDFSAIANIDPDRLRPEFRYAVDQICKAEDPLLHPADRTKLVEEIVNESLGVRPPAPTPQLRPGDVLAERADKVHRKLIGSLDFSFVGPRDEDKLRAEIRKCAQEICDTENPLLDPAERASIVDAVMNKTFGDRSQESPQQNSDRVAVDSSPATPRGNSGTETPQESDSVDCTLFAPPTARREEPFMVQVFVHMPEEAEAAARDAREFDDDAQRRGATSLGTEITRGSMLTFELCMRDAVIEEPVRDFVWRGRRASVQFGVEVPAACTRENLIGTMTVSQNSIPIGTVTFKLKLAAASIASSATPVPTGEARRYTQAFISYASRDRSEVIRRVQMLKTVGISFFQDVLDLEPGERWAQRLYERIDHSDVLFLFWSSAAKESEWVAKEWQYALEKKGDDFVRPVGIEGPPIPEPPAELAHLHFGDPLLYFIR